MAENWLELTVTTSSASVEAVSAKLMELGCNGVAIEDPADLEFAKKANAGDIFPVLLPGMNKVVIKGYLPLSLFTQEKAGLLKKFLAGLPELGLAPATLEVQEVTDTSWEDSWKKYWQVTPVGKRFLIVPAWLEIPPGTNRLPLVLDPGPAFGNGTHETTRICLEFLEESLEKGETVLDFGCGSGILALCASLAGAGRVFGYDRDELAVQYSRKNASLNRIENACFLQADLLDDDFWLNVPRADMMLANLTADLVAALSEKFHGAALPGGKLICSGIINARRDEVVSALEKSGFLLKKEKRAGEWTGLYLELVT